MPDARVQSAVEHWAPRFIQAGMDYSDFNRTVAGVERWDDWLDAFAGLGDFHARRAEDAESSGRRVTAGEAWLHAAVAFHFAKFVWVLDAARARAVADRAVAAIYAAHHHLDPAAERIEAKLDGERIVGNLRIPWYDERPPLVFLIPGLDSTKEEFYRLENVFLARGMATLSLDGPGQGEGGYALPIRHDYEVAVAAMLDALAGRDRDRPRPRRRAGREPRRLPRAARRRVRAADQGRRGDLRRLQLRRAVGPHPGAHARDVRPQVARRVGRGRARAGAASWTSTACSGASRRPRCSSPASATG